MLTKSQRRALRLIAFSRDGATEALLVANRVTLKTIVALVKAGYVDVRVEQLARRRLVEVARLTITPAGRAAIG